MPFALPRWLQPFYQAHIIVTTHPGVTDMDDALLHTPAPSSSDVQTPPTTVPLIGREFADIISVSEWAPRNAVLCS